MKMMERQFAHSLLPVMTKEELARQDFVQSFKLHLATKIAPTLKKIFEHELKRAAPGASDSPTRKQVAALLEEHPYYRTWGSLARTGQELGWNSVTGPVSRQVNDLAHKASAISHPKGTLTLNPALPMPSYLTALDVHCMPGGYCTEQFPGDVAQGAIYDRGVHIYAMGGGGPRTDGAGRLTSTYFKSKFPDLAPRRILDLGCGVGHALLPYADAYPDAEIHGVDVGAPLLRYGHARAEAMGVAVHFKQMNAEALDYPDAHFDMVLSHIMLHETSKTALRRIMRECHRVARPGALVAHLDLCFFAEMDGFNGFMLEWDTLKNNEPFWSTFRKLNARMLFAEAGFAEERLFNVKLSRNYQGQAVFRDNMPDAGRGTWNLIGAIR